MFRGTSIANPVEYATDDQFDVSKLTITCIALYSYNNTVRTVNNVHAMDRCKISFRVHLNAIR